MKSGLVQEPVHNHGSLMPTLYSALRACTNWLTKGAGITILTTANNNNGCGSAGAVVDWGQLRKQE